MAQKFSFLKDTSCTINVESCPLRTTFGWPEGHGLDLSEGDDDHSVSLGTLGETNGKMNFASSKGSWLGLCFTMGLLGQMIGMSKVVFPNFSSQLPRKGFY
jgi:hypothetical protein